MHDGGPTHEHRATHWHQPFQFFLLNSLFHFAILAFFCGYVQLLDLFFNCFICVYPMNLWPKEAVGLLSLRGQLNRCLNPSA